MSNIQNIVSRNLFEYQTILQMNKINLFKFRNKYKIKKKM